MSTFEPAAVAFAILAHAVVAAGAVVRRMGPRDPLAVDRARQDLQDALARTERSGAHAPR